MLILKIIYVFFRVWLICLFIVLLQSLWEARKNQIKMRSMIKKPRRK